MKKIFLLLIFLLPVNMYAEEYTAIIGEPRSDGAGVIIACPDGGYVVQKSYEPVDNFYHPKLEKYNKFHIKTNEWVAPNYGSPNYNKQIYASLKSSFENGLQYFYVFGSISTDFMGTKWAGIIIKIDSNLNEVWTNPIIYNAVDQFRNIVIVTKNNTSTGIFALSSTSDHLACWIMFDLNGNIMNNWSLHIEESTSEAMSNPLSALQIDDDLLLIYGYKFHSYGYFDSKFLKIDIPSGNIVASKFYKSSDFRSHYYSTAEKIYFAGEHYGYGVLVPYNAGSSDTNSLKLQLFDKNLNPLEIWCYYSSDNKNIGFTDKNGNASIIGHDSKNNLLVRMCLTSDRNVVSIVCIDNSGMVLWSHPLNNLPEGDISSVYAISRSTDNTYYCGGSYRKTNTDESDSLIYIWKPEFSLPIASLGSTKKIMHNQYENLDASGSYCPSPERKIMSYFWRIITPPNRGLGKACNQSYDAPNSMVDIYLWSTLIGTDMIAEVVVTDDLGNKDVDSCKISIVQNLPPVAVPRNITVKEGDIVVLESSDSYDPDGYISQYSWSQPSNQHILLSGNNPKSEGSYLANPSFTAPEVGPNGATYTFFLYVVDDGQTGSNKSTCTVTVINILKKPISNAGEDQVVSEGDIITLNSNNSTIGDYPISTYHWEIENGNTTINNSNNSSVSFKAPEVGIGGENISIKLIVTDTQGNSSSDTVSVFVNNIDQGPTAKAGDDQNVEEGDQVYLSSAGSVKGDFPIVSYVWEVVKGTVLLTNSDTDTPWFVAPQAGIGGETITLRLTVTDSYGYSNSDIVNVIVNNINKAPTANAGVDQTINEKTTVKLSGSGNDPDGNPITYLWSQISGPAVTLINATSANPSFTAPDVDTNGASLVFRLTTSDGTLVATDTCMVTVDNDIDDGNDPDPEDPPTPTETKSDSGGGGGGCFINSLM